jgi:hypothetical protein
LAGFVGEEEGVDLDVPPDTVDIQPDIIEPLIKILLPLKINGKGSLPKTPQKGHNPIKSMPRNPSILHQNCSLRLDPLRHRVPHPNRIVIVWESGVLERRGQAAF